MEWISVKDRVPENNKMVIVCGGIAYRDGTEWFTITGEPYPGRIIQWNVTHWMPFPESPEAQS